MARMSFDSRRPGGFFNDTYSSRPSSDKEHRVKVYLYTRPLEEYERVPSVTAFEHWGIVVEFCEYDEEEGLPGKFLYEANDEQGILWSRYRRFKAEDMNKPGAKLKRISAGKTVKTSVRKLEEFCVDWNREEYNYAAPHSTCHQFAQTFVNMLGLSLTEWSAQDVAVGALIGGVLGVSAAIGTAYSISRTARREEDDDE